MLVFKCPECEEEYDVTEYKTSGKDDGGNEKLMECKNCGAKISFDKKKTESKQSGLGDFSDSSFEQFEIEDFNIREEVATCDKNSFVEYVFTRTPACDNFEVKDGFTYSSPKQAPEICGNCKNFNKVVDDE